MSSNLGTITYGNLSVLPAYDVLSGGPGNLIVSGTLLAGSNASVQGQFNVVGPSLLNNSLTVNGYALFNDDATFNGLSTFTGQIHITDTTVSTNATTGALVVAGGVGILGAMNLDGTLNVAGATQLASTLGVTGKSTFADIVTITKTTESTQVSNGALVVAGGLGVAGSIRSGVGNLFLAERLILNSDVATGKTYLGSPSGDLYINDSGTHDVHVNSNSAANFNVATALTVNNDGVHVLTATNSTSPTTGGLLVDGGLGVQLSVNIGGDITAPVDKTLTVGYVIATNTAQATSVSTGAIVTSGGLGVAKNTYVGGFLDVASAAGVASSIGNFRLLSGTGVNYFQSTDVARTDKQWTPVKFAPLGQVNASIMTVNATQVVIDQTTESDSASTGAFVVSGGAGFGGAVNIDGIATFNNITQHQQVVYMNEHELYLGSTDDHGLVYENGGPLLFGLSGGALGVGAARDAALSWDANLRVLMHGDLFVKSTSWTSPSGSDIVLSANTSSLIFRNEPDTNSGAFISTLTDFAFNTTTQGSTASYKTFNIDKATGHVTILNTDEATGLGTGSLQTAGGQSISKSLHVGEDAFIHGSLQVAGSISTLGEEGVIFSNTTDSTSTTTGSVVILGGVGVAKNMNVGGIVHIVNTEGSLATTGGALIVDGGVGIAENVMIGGLVDIAGAVHVSGDTVFSSTTQSVSVSSGAVSVQGGVGIGGQLYVGGRVFFTNTTNATSTTSGALVVSGGVGIAKDVYIAGFANVTHTVDSTSKDNGAFTVTGGVGIGKSLNVGGTASVGGDLAVLGATQLTGTLHILDTTDSATFDTGALIVDGGFGVAKNVRVGSTVESTTATSGAAVIAGGLGLGKNFTLGGNQVFTGDNPLVTFNTSGNAAPTFGTRSIGSRIVFQKALGVASGDYATGIDAHSLWHSVPVNAADNEFAWYGGVDKIVSLDGTGVLTLYSTEGGTGTGSGALRVHGGAGIMGAVYVGGTMNVTGSAFFSSSVMANANVGITGILNVTNVTESSDNASGSIVTAGGLGVAKNVNVGGNLSVQGDVDTIGNTTTTGTVHVTNTLDSVSDVSGALVVDGGIGVSKSAHIGGQLVVGGNTTISGNLYVSGTRTEIESNVLTTKDNVILVNSGPSGSATSGYAMKRYQSANDNRDGDVIDETPEITGTMQDGSTATTVVLSMTASSVDGFYNGAWILITNGTGVDQVRRINTYNGSTRTATIFSTADQATLNVNPVEGKDFTTVPDATSEYAIFTSQYVVTVYDETQDEYVMGLTSVNPISDPSVATHRRLAVHARTLKLDDSLAVNEIHNETPGTGTTVEGILHKDHAISGITSLNGGIVDLTQTVTLVDNNATGFAAVPGTKPYGSYIVLVSDVNEAGASATFLISGSTAYGGFVMRASSVPGSSSEQVTLKWHKGQTPIITFLQLPVNGTGTTYTYKIKTIAVV